VQYVSASAEWRLVATLPARPTESKDIRTQGGTLARGTRLRLPWAMIGIPYGEIDMDTVTY